MCTRIRNGDWNEDMELYEQLKSHLKHGLSQREILSYVQRDFDCYAWSERTLKRRIAFFNLKREDTQATIEDVIETVGKELEGPGRLRGYRHMHTQLKKVHDVHAPRDVVYAVMGILDPDGLEGRRPGKEKKRKKGNFSSVGPNYVHSLDGHDKMMGYQNSTFPLAIYGCIDTCSRKIMWVKVWTNNSDPRVPAKWYAMHLFKTKVIPRYLRLDN